MKMKAQTPDARCAMLQIQAVKVQTVVSFTKIVAMAVAVAVVAAVTATAPPQQDVTRIATEEEPGGAIVKATAEIEAVAVAVAAVLVATTLPSTMLLRLISIMM